MGKSNTQEEIEAAKRAERWIGVQKIYRLVLINGWYIKNFHDKWSPDSVSFLLWNPDSGRAIIRLPK